MQVRPFDNMEARGLRSAPPPNLSLIVDNIVDEPVTEMVRQGGGTVAYPGLTNE